MHAPLEILKGIHVLYVEDDAVIRKQYTLIFQHFFDHLYVASSADEGIEIFEKETIQLVITDLKMPEMNGLEMLKIIREIDPKIPAFITSSYAEKEDLLGAVRLQLVDYLIKPLSYSAIKEALFRCIELMERENLLQATIDQTTLYSFVSKQLLIKESAITLPHKEALLLELLLKNRGNLVSRELIESSIYGLDESMSESALRNLVSKLRKKLPQDLIQTHRNGGYTLL